jgi:PAS domain S-box-containing protein
VSEGAGATTGPAAARAPWERRGAAAALVAAGPVAVGLADLATDLRVFPSLLCLLAIGGAAAIGGRWFGLAAAFTSFVAFNFFFTDRHHSFDGTDWESVAAGVLFGVTAISISWLISRESRARTAGEEARRVAEASSARAQRLQLLAGALAEAYTPQQVLDATLSEGVTAADARAGLLAAVTTDGTHLEVIAQRGYEEELVGADGRWAQFPLDADLPLSEAVRTLEPVFVNSRAERDARFPLLRDTARESHAVACLPLVLEGEAFGGIVFSFGRDDVLDAERRRLKVAIANQVAQALARARLLEVANAAHARADFLAEASAVLASSLDYEQTLARLARLTVPRLADWCSIDMTGPQGSIERLTVAHQDPEKVAWARELQQRFPPNPDEPRGAANVLRTGEPEFMPQIPQELLDGVAAERPELAEVIEQLGLRSWICVPLRARGTTLGALSLVAAESGRTFTDVDLELAVELANRAAVAVDNARLYRESERRGDAARALEYTADGVALVDESGRVRYWNPAAAVITGVPVADAVGRALADVLPAWADVDRHVVAAPAGAIARPATLPLPRADGERWVSVTAVVFDEGAVYAIRDVTAERALEQARSDFVATASHELRTPIAAVYGAVRTLRRPDVEFSDEDKEVFLQIIETEGERLGNLVEQILVAGQIDADTVRVTERPVDIVALADAVVASARVRAPENIELVLDANGAMPPLSCDEDKLRQVLVNLVENAVKYSPDGGMVRVEIRAENGRGRVAVHDEGLGIPADEQRRIFEKFFRLDPSLTRGVGGSGLGLYISRELVERMDGRLTVASEPGRGSTFTVDLPVA